MASLTGNHLYLSYESNEKRLSAVRDVNISIQSGQLTFLSGARCSGKTSLLYMLGCLLRPDSGEVFVNGLATSRLAEGERALLRHRNIGFVFQTLHLFDTLTVLQNVMVLLDIGGKADSSFDLAISALRRVGLERKRDVIVAELSAGERRLLAIARALVRDPGILLADEPADPLDDRSGEIADLLVNLARGGRIVTVASRHAQWKDYARHHLRIENGAIVYDQRIRALH